MHTTHLSSIQNVGRGGGGVLDNFLKWHFDRIYFICIGQIYYTHARERWIESLQRENVLQLTSFWVFCLYDQYLWKCIGDFYRRFVYPWFRLDALTLYLRVSSVFSFKCEVENKWIWNCLYSLFTNIKLYLYANYYYYQALIIVSFSRLAAPLKISLANACQLARA